jgi:hypothetical protein
MVFRCERADIRGDSYQPLRTTPRIRTTTEKRVLKRKAPAGVGEGLSL